MADEQVRLITVRVRTDDGGALKSLADSLGGINSNVKSLAGGMNQLRSTFVGYFAVLQVRALTNISDQMQSLFDRISILTGGTDAARTTFQGLLDVADKTRQPLAQVGQVYQTLALQTKQFGTSSAEVLDITNLLINTYRLSGKSAEDAAAGATVLAKSFATGVIDGRALRTELNQNVFLGQLLSKTYGANIFKETQEGTIKTADLFKILFKNADDINGKAGQLSATFGQTATKALNDFSAQVLTVNQTLGLSNGFAYLLDLVEQKSGLIAVAIAGVAVTAFPALITAIEAATTASIAFAVANPILTLMAALGVAVIAVFKNFDQLVVFLKKVEIGFISLALAGLNVVKTLDEFIVKTTGLASAAKDLNTVNQAISNLTAKQDALKASTAEMQGPPKELFEQNQKIIDERNKLEASLRAHTPEETLQQLLKRLNAEYKNTGDVSAYYAALNQFDATKLSKEFRDGKINLDQLLEGMQKVKEIKINQAFNSGATSFEDFDNAIRQTKINDLKVKLDAGKISLIEYNEQLVQLEQKLDLNGALQAGTSEFIKSIGTVSQNIANGVKDAFGSLETGLEDFIKTGTFNFSKFTQDILDDLEKIIIRATIIQPLANAVLGAFNPGVNTSGIQGNQTATSGLVAAHGAAFNEGGTRAFAAGGIVTRTTPFGYNGNKRGIMGEAGPEAILPLTRNSKGDLGVASAQAAPVTVNINNNSQAEVSQKTTTGANGERQIELLIQDKVKTGIANGAFDRAFSGSYGLQRKGS